MSKEVRAVLVSDIGVGGGAPQQERCRPHSEWGTVGRYPSDSSPVAQSDLPAEVGDHKCAGVADALEAQKNRP